MTVRPVAHRPPAALLAGCSSPDGAARKAGELVSRLPVVAQFQYWANGARRMLALCLFAAASHPDPWLRGDPSLLLVWLRGNGHDLSQAAHVLRRVGGAEGRRAASDLDEMCKLPVGQRSAFSSLARSAVVRAAVNDADPCGPL